jgi:hypothetical protein
MVLYLCVLIVFSLRRESLKLILVNEPLPEVFCHILFKLMCSSMSLRMQTFIVNTASTLVLQRAYHG